MFKGVRFRTFPNDMNFAQVRVGDWWRLSTLSLGDKDSSGKSLLQYRAGVPADLQTNPQRLLGHWQITFEVQ
jgi:hypothetical protein